MEDSRITIITNQAPHTHPHVYTNSNDNNDPSCCYLVNSTQKSGNFAPLVPESTRAIDHMRNSNKSITLLDHNNIRNSMHCHHSKREKLEKMKKSKHFLILEYGDQMNGQEFKGKTKTDPIVILDDEKKNHEASSLSPSLLLGKRSFQANNDQDEEVIIECSKVYKKQRIMANPNTSLISSSSCEFKKPLPSRLSSSLSAAIVNGLLTPIAGTYKGFFHITSLDCEMVIVEGNINEVARCSIVNYNGHIIFDKFIKPTGKIISYMTWINGIKFQDLKGCNTFDEHKSEIFSILCNRRIVGHSLEHDFKALGYTPHDKRNIRDLKYCNRLNDIPHVFSLKKMAEKHLKIKIQVATHDSVEDARATMLLYKMFENEWETSLQQQIHGDN